MENGYSKRISKRKKFDFILKLIKYQGKRLKFIK